MIAFAYSDYRFLMVHVHYTNGEVEEMEQCDFMLLFEEYDIS